MSTFSRNFRHFCLLILTVFATSTRSEQIVLDVRGDLSGEWFNVTCHVNDDYTDFWAYGCPRTPKTASAPTAQGFFAPCGALSCDILYNGGALPKAKKLTLFAYNEVASDLILVSGKVNVEDPEFDQVIGSFVSETPGWLQQVIDLSTKDISVLKFNLIGDTIILDKIVIDLDDSVSTHVLLDTKKDMTTTHWKDGDCHYMDTFEDFWVFGCPLAPSGINSAGSGVGYWSPCASGRNCTIQYYNSMGASSVQVRTYLEGDARVVVTRQEKPGLSVGATPTEVQTITLETTSGGGWTTLELPEFSAENHVLNFQLIQGTNGFVLLDSVYVDLNSSEGSDPDPDDSGASILISSTLVLIMSLILVI